MERRRGELIPHARHRAWGVLKGPWVQQWERWLHDNTRFTGCRLRGPMVCSCRLLSVPDRARPSRGRRGRRGAREERREKKASKGSAHSQVRSG